MGSDLISLPPEAANELIEAVLAFRSGYEQYDKPDDVKALLELFPRVSLRQGYILDYVQEKTPDGVILPIHPFARPRDDESWTPMVDQEDGLERADLVDELYQYLEFEPSPDGLFEYSLFVIELRSMRASSHIAEWLDSTPIFTEERFDEFLEKASKVSDVKRPENFGPWARRDEDGGGRARFLVHTPFGWERIYYLENKVYGDGFVEQEAGDIVADMGSGLIF
ncbi:hypothetical protein ACFL6X_07460 [Candidatus Latescibacterota bacterium]